MSEVIRFDDGKARLSKDLGDLNAKFKVWLFHSNHLGCVNTNGNQFGEG